MQQPVVHHQATGEVAEDVLGERQFPGQADVKQIDVVTIIIEARAQIDLRLEQYFETDVNAVLDTAGDRTGGAVE